MTMLEKNSYVHMKSPEGLIWLLMREAKTKFIELLKNITGENKDFRFLL